MKTIGFACTTIFHYIHFRRIAEKMDEKVFFIIFTPKLVRDRYDRLESFFIHHNIPYCDFKDVIEENINFDAIVSPYYLPSFQFINPNIKKVRMLYGYAKDLWNYAEWNKGFDLILTYGPYSEDRLNKMAKTVNVGHPRFKYDYPAILKDINSETLTLKKDKPIILFCPTWGSMSSVQQFLNIVEELTKDYYVVIKLHHGNVLSDKIINWDRITLNNHIFIFDEHTDLFDLFPYSDVVISDYSGAIFDAMIVEKPIILLDILDSNIDNTGILNLKHMQNVAKYDIETINTEEQSLDMYVRDLLPHTSDLKKIKEMIGNILCEDFNPNYLELNKKLYSYFDDLAPERAACEIMRVVEDQKKERKVDSFSFSLINIQKLNQFIEKIKGKRIVIWGAGEIGQVLYYWLKRNGIHVLFFIDRDKNKNGLMVEDIKIVDDMDFQKEQNIFVLIAVSSAVEKIEHELLVQGLTNEKDYISIFN
ncbi:CDP-glycerol glycerophosphotransferase family protein [Heyndrickxia sporothermodurans]